MLKVIIFWFNSILKNLEVERKEWAQNLPSSLSFISKNLNKANLHTQNSLKHFFVGVLSLKVIFEAPNQSNYRWRLTT